LAIWASNRSSAVLRRLSNVIRPECTVLATMLSVIALTAVTSFVFDPVSGAVASVGEGFFVVFRSELNSFGNSVVLKEYEMPLIGW
jgi:Zn-dependent protease